ncbi:C-terminal processing peptidase-2, Serine peptidase, MEROPS family S41A [Prochlorococcus marinus str. MIT 9312]|uniref:C-terminal processing peptidase-2, Serine peptidase, MEROPS family S41A n=1 Tax=Prochlorococcus marinus (strain MIT 9312) TaxID=74546 RepID=Q31BK7_PROM9|nr:S41 family peptidase [Prochlorococcus marinus]ABB49738.1 C-terminal processing peptidase-2, Serine peptidase, MEROPS family S41A [Prochlorococcus marinus str. MIT 9312]KGF99296.1 Carboxyl-terminal protease [Prochlorococcus marinus str. MIT 9311]
MKIRKLLKKNFIILFATTFSGLFLNNFAEATVLNNSYKEVIDHVWQIVYRDFLDSSGKFQKSNWINLRKEVLSKTYSDSNEAYDAIRDMLSNLDDSYTRFLEPKEFNQMRIDTSGELTGVGIQIVKDKESDDLIIISPIEGTPAFDAGIKARDKILSIDDISTEGMNIEEAVKLIRGQRGTKVKLEILRGSKSFFKILSRERIEIKTVSTKVNQAKNGLLIGYVRIKQFNANASKETRDAIKDLETKKVAGYVLDLRSNPGGLLESSIEISRHFINKGVIVSTVSKDGLKETKRGNGQALTKKPLVVLVNEGSASASEIVSGAIKDNKRGKLVGKKTFGKGLVQSMRTLVDGSGLTVTVAKYLTPNGTDINESGIIPDIEVKMNINPILQREIGTRKDKQYRAGEKELVNIIKRNNNISEFNPNTANLNALLKINKENKVFSLN